MAGNETWVLCVDGWGGWGWQEPLEIGSPIGRNIDDGASELLFAHQSLAATRYPKQIVPVPNSNLTYDCVIPI